MKVKVVGKQPNSALCFVCGLKNNKGLKARFYELENDELISIFTPSEEHQSYPSRLHGGISATILDETIGRAIMISEGNIWGVTIDFQTRFRKPVELDGEIRVITKIEKSNKRSFQGSGKILNKDGEVAVEGKGTYLKMDIEKIADFDHEGEDWRVISDPDDPEYFEFDD